MSTQTEIRPARAQPGDGLAHYCRVHRDDCGCDADPAACVAYCGYRFDEDETWNDGSMESCVVCDAMFDADNDGEDACDCATCERISDAAENGV